MIDKRSIDLHTIDYHCGVIVWKDVQLFGFDRNNRERLFDPQYDGDWFYGGHEHYLQYQTNHAEERLDSVIPYPQVSWERLNLPGSVRCQILKYALYFDQVVELVLDIDTCLPYGAAFVNRAFYEEWWGLCVHRSAFKLRMSTDNLRSCFSGFGALKRLLRKECTGNHHRPLFHDWIEVSIVLDVKSSTPAPIAYVRISILPLLLGLPQLFNHSDVTVRLWSFTNCVDHLTAERTFNLNKLRGKVAAALENSVYLYSDGYPAEI
ncbi:hypothetical protein E8E11_007449 [Didymella keratinophila]|nr:hypothetical protein E8E11_007449 [Didymella keratinophila]